MFRPETTFAALVVAQAGHSIEEYVGRLWEDFPPARIISSLISSNLERGFVVFNVSLVAFGAWCWLFPVRRKWKTARAFMWPWIVIETLNGIGHPVWTLWQQQYTPGVITAPILLVLALSLAVELLRKKTL